MIEEPRVIETEEQRAAVIPLEIPRSEMQEAFQAGMDELMEVLSEQGLEPAGPVFAHHFSFSPDSFDFELGVPVPARVKSQGRVEPGTLPAARVARTVYHGDYTGLPSAWGEFDAWIEAQGLEKQSDVWESYVKGPHTSADTSTWRTELSRPLAKTETTVE